MPSLLCTLGSSWAVVPEAFLLGNGVATYRAITVITTDSEVTRNSLAKVNEWFFNHHPRTIVRALPIDGLVDLASAEDHRRFEEGLYRAYFAMLQEGDEVHVCLSGGFKTMSAAAHEAAGLLGCGKLFHVSVPLGTLTETHDEILDAIACENVRLIELGSRSGWPTIRELAPQAPLLPQMETPFRIKEFSLSDAIRLRLEGANRLSANEHELATLPFPQIARWTPAQRDWLSAPLDPFIDGEWLLDLPKIELHCHLGGFASHGSLLQQVRNAATHPCNLPSLIDPITPLDWPMPVNAIGLEDYRKLGDTTGSKLLNDPGCLKKHIELFYAHLQEQHIIYAEIRCSPANYTSHGRSAWAVLCEIRNHFETCQNDAANANANAPRVNLIIIATRQAGGDFRTAISRHLALAATSSEHWTDKTKPRVVGVDLAGYEDKATRAHYYREDFMAALRLGMGITVHAGENDDAEGIWSAILDLNTRRLGHALHLADSPTLLKTAADRHIGIEMCPYANLQIKGFPLDAETMANPRAYPLLKYLQAGIPVTVNTDNIGISAASLTDNLLLLPRLCPGITRLHILQLLRNSIDQSFLSSNEKNLLLSSVHIPH